MAKKICSFTENVTPFGTPSFTTPEGSGEWVTLGMFGGRTFHSFNDEITTFSNVVDDHDFKVYDLTDDEDYSAVKAALVNFHDIHNRIKQMEDKFREGSYSALVKKLMDRDEDLLAAIAACEQEKLEYMQSLGFTSTEILEHE